MKNMTLALVLGAFTLTAMPAHAATDYPKITAKDLANCKKEIAELHRLEINYIKGEVQERCAKSRKNYDPESCKHSKEWLSNSSAKSDLAWYMEGNKSCEDSEYPCYGVHIYNGADPDLEFIRTLANGVDIFGDWVDYSYVVDKCVANLWLKKLEAKTEKSPQAKGSITPTVSDIKRSSSSNSAGLSPQQITTCSEEIKRKQIESQSWGGDVNDVSARLGQFQKNLFEGRCAGHPEAKAYIAGANKMLGYKIDAPNLTPAPTAGANPEPSTFADSRPSAKREKRQHVPEAVATNCLTVSEKPGFGGFVNSCNYAVYYTYCAEHPKKDAWTESFDCDKGRHGLGSDVVGANNTQGSHTKGAKKIHWAACKYKEPDGTYAGISVVDVKWDAQKRTLNFRCSE